MPLDEKLDTTELRLAPALQFKFDDSSAKGVISGLVSTFLGAPDSYGDVMARGCFARSLKEHRLAGTMPPLLWAHQTHVPIGRITQLLEDGVGLRMTAQLNLQTSAGKEAYAHLLHNDVSGLSFGFKEIKRQGAELIDVNLYECSVVALPANPRARVDSVKGVATKREFKALLREAGLPKGAIEKLANGGWPALVVAADEDDPEILQLARRVEAATAELKSRG